jgi:YVTN family beta-propeller protein
MIPVHAVLAPDGRVLTFGTQGTQLYDVWDPSAGLDGGHLTLPNTIGSNLFCSAALLLPGGNGVFIAGGGPETGTNNSSRVFDYGNNTLTRYDDLNRGRYYATTITLPDGRTYIQGGTGGADVPEIRDVNGSIELLAGVDTSELKDYYPRNFVAPDGRVFGFDTDGAMYYVDTSGTGSLNRRDTLGAPIGNASTAAMFRPGRILEFGARSSGARIIDITGNNPVITNTQPLSSQRNWSNATILADGRVLATGGSEVRNELVGVNNSAEIWNPNTGQWSRGAIGSIPRLYHSIALLLPDGSVLVGGGGNPGPLFNNNIEIYYPPYLYDADGGWAARPVIIGAPGFIDINEPFTVDIADGASISRVVLVKTGAVTHSFNMEQRFVELAFQSSGGPLTVQAPTRATDAPPGYYLLFAFDQRGTPSIARIVRMGVAATSDGSAAPDLANPGNQVGETGVFVSLQLEATDPNGDTLTYDANGLPAGLSIDSASGVIAGTPTTVGTYNVIVNASDGLHADSKAFTWTISGSSETFTLLPPTPPAPAVAGSEVTLQASVEGGTSVLFKWDFDDGSPETPYSSDPLVHHTFTGPGIYYVTVTAVDAGGLPQVSTVVVTIHLPLTALRPTASTNIAIEHRTGAPDHLWVVNQDNDSVSVFDTSNNAKIAEINVGPGPRSVAFASSGEVWVTNKFGASISVLNSSTFALGRTVPLPFASQPFGIAMEPSGSFAYVVLEGSGRLLKIDTSNDELVGIVDVGANPRHVSVSADGNRVFVSRYVTLPLPGEDTGTVVTDVGGEFLGGEVVVVRASSMLIEDTIRLRHSEKPDFETQGRGIPNYLGAVAISPDGQSAWIPSKQDNIKRGVLRDGQGLDFQSTIRAVSSRIELGSLREDYPARIDLDNSSVATAIAFDRFGIYMFIALETSREVAVVDAHGKWEIFRFKVGRAPQGLAVSASGKTLYVHNFMDRTIGVYDIARLVDEGIAEATLVASRSTVTAERLTAQVLLGKQLFYDAKDPRLARDAYISCASCHNDGAHDGRVWDMTGFGEGLRNTIQLRGRAGGHGFLHWSNNFDEVQDFEGQIRALAGGTGLMTNAQLNTGTRNQPLGDRKAGISNDLDALAAYVASLNVFASSPFRDASGNLTNPGQAGSAIFAAKGCGSCHSGTAFTNSGNNNPQDIGTITSASGNRLGGPLTGIDVPTLRDAFATAPYLHRGSAATLADAIRAHRGVSVSDAEMSDLVAYVSQIGNQEPSAPGTAVSSTPNTGTGLAGSYYNNVTVSGTPALQRTEAVNFGWTSNSPGPGVNKDRFSVRWTGLVEAPVSGNYRFQTASNDGVRLWINGTLVIDDWVAHATKNDDSPVIALVKNQRYAVAMEYYDDKGTAVARLRWLRPSQATYAAVPATRLYRD